VRGSECTVWDLGCGVEVWGQPVVSRLLCARPSPGDMPPYTLHPGDLDNLRTTNVQRFRGGLVFKAHRLCVSPVVARLLCARPSPGDMRGTHAREPGGFEGVGLRGFEGVGFESLRV